MKARHIIGAILMAVLTVAGIVLSFGGAITRVLSSEGIIKSMIEVDYLAKSEQEARNVLLNYLGAEKADTVLNDVSVKSDIREIAAAFDNNTVVEVAENMKENLKETIIETLDDDVQKNTKESFATVVSNEYIKTIFPVSEFNILSSIYEKYSTKLFLGDIILAVICIGIYIYLALGKKTYKWAIIALYNITILNLIVLSLVSIFNGIVIGNERTTAVIVNILDTIKTNVVLYTIIIFVIAVVSNYLAYFKKRKHSR